MGKKEYAVPLNHTNRWLLKSKILACLQASGMPKLQLIIFALRYSSCAQNTWNLGMIIEHAHKKAEPVKLTSLVNFGRPSGSGTKKGV